MELLCRRYLLSGNGRSIGGKVARWFANGISYVRLDLFVASIGYKGICGNEIHARTRGLQLVLIRKYRAWNFESFKAFR